MTGIEQKYCNSSGNYQRNINFRIFKLMQRMDNGIFISWRVLLFVLSSCFCCGSPPSCLSCPSSCPWSPPCLATWTCRRGYASSSLETWRKIVLTEASLMSRYVSPAARSAPLSPATVSGPAAIPLLSPVAHLHFNSKRLMLYWGQFGEEVEIFGTQGSKSWYQRKLFYTSHSWKRLTASSSEYFHLLVTEVVVLEVRQAVRDDLGEGQKMEVELTADSAAAAGERDCGRY